MEGVLLKGKRIVIPISMRSQMLHLTHEGHLGIEKCNGRARALLYWPQMNKDIESYIQRCDTCQQHRYRQQKEPLLAHSRPNEPWRKVGADLFHLAGKDYLVMVDYFSNYPEVAFLTDTTAKQVIKHCKAIFARHGIPVTVVSDNGPQFSSQEFKDFADSYEFNHVTSSPLFPQSNGLAEKAVQIVKRLFKKAAETRSDIYLALLNYRTSPLECGKSPAELLMSRELRTRLPSASLLLEKEEEQRTNQAKQTQAYNKTAKPLSPLSQEDVVRVRCDGRWGPVAKIIRETAPRSYEVITEYGSTLRRNRRHLLKVPKTSFVELENRRDGLMKNTNPKRPTSTQGTSDIVHAPSDTTNVTPANAVQERPRRNIVKPKRLIEEY
ncbi:unnamed protein product [Knipowitschia caucasica]